MNFKYTSIISLFLVALTSMNSAHAELKDYYNDCMNQYETINNAKIYECTGYADEKYKSAMNKAYNKIYKSLKTNARSSSDAADFEKSQLGWLDYRDQHCGLEGMYIGSPAYPICVSDKNKARAEELMSFSENF